MNERDLLRDFVQSGSEAALGELLRRYLPLVYSVALRQTRNDTLLSGEIAQETFCIFARKAPTLPDKVVLSSWLCRTTLHLAQKAVRAESRRRRREEAAVAMQSLQQPDGNELSWEEIAPHIDASLDLMPEADRSALILRFFERKRMRDLAQDLEISEEAARMRVSRALGRLRDLLARRGLPVSVGALTALLSVETIGSVPVAIAQSIEHRVLRGAASNRVRDAARFSSRQSRHWLTASVLVGFLVGLPLLLKPGRTNSTFGSTVVEEKPSARLADQPPATASAAEPSFDFDGAAAVLRKALRDPWNSRVPPFERVEQALANYGKHRRAAAPVLMEMLLGERKNHTYESQVLAAHGLIILGSDASESLNDLVILHDSGDLSFLDDRQSDLFAAIDLFGITIPEFLKEIVKSPATQPITVSILANLLRNNPGAAPLYKEQLYDLLHSAATGPVSAIVLAQVPTLYEPEVLPVLLRFVQSAHSIHWAQWYSGGDSWVKPLLLPAVNALGELRDSSSIPALLELSQIDDLPLEIRDAAMAAAAKIDPSTRVDLAEVKTWYQSHEQGLQLAEKARKNEATAEELIAALDHRESANIAAQRISQDKALVSKALPSILHSVESFGDNDAIACLRLVPVSQLVDQVRSGNTDGLQYVANAVALGKPDPKEVAPVFDEILDHLDQRKLTTHQTVIALQNFHMETSHDLRWMCLDESAVHELRGGLAEMAQLNSSWETELSPLISYLEGKVYARRSRCEELLKPLLENPDIHLAFSENRRIANITYFLPMLQTTLLRPPTQ